MRDTQRVALSPKLTVEHTTGSRKPDPTETQISELEARVREIVRIDAAIKALEAQKEGHKQFVAETLGDSVIYVHYRGKKRWWKLRTYVNYSLVPALVQTKLEAHQELLDKYLKEGLIVQFILPASKKTQKLVRATAEDAIDKLGGIVKFIKSQLEAMLYEPQLVAECREKKISLAGTQARHVTVFVEEEEQPSR